jgi:hypothetical protein
MPCGGIYPVDVSRWAVALAPGDASCWQCGKGLSSDIPASFCEEWDTFLHDACIDAFLASDEGQIVIGHGHEIIRRTDNAPKCLGSSTEVPPRFVEVWATLRTEFTMRIPLEESIPDPPAFECDEYVSAYLKAFSSHDMTIQFEAVTAWEYTVSACDGSIVEVS